MVFPEGSQEAQTMGLLDHVGGRLAVLDRFVVQHPELRIKRRTDDLPEDVDQAVISTIRLVKKDDSPTRITGDRLQIWTSPNNWQYQQKQVAFSFSESVEAAPHDFRDAAGNVLTRAGQPVRVLTLSELHLTDKYILVTTDFTEGPADFVNAGTEMVQVLDDQGRPLPVSVATGGFVWCANLINFRNGGLAYDYGWGAAPVTLDAPNTNGRQGFVAFTRGRPAYLTNALCETEPAVQEFWLQCLEEMIAAGVDGVDFREENHSTHTDYPEDYGFNEVIVRQCEGLQGQALLAKIAQVRGNAWTDFLTRCRRRLQAAGAKMRYHLQADWLRPDRPPARALAYPANIDWQWRRWVD